MVAETATRPSQAAIERALVADFAETALLHGFKVSSHTVKDDHEREETTLTVKFVKSSGAEKQGVLKMAKGSENGQEDGS